MRMVTVLHCVATLTNPSLTLPPAHSSLQLHRHLQLQPAVRHGGRPVTGARGRLGGRREGAAGVQGRGGSEAYTKCEKHTISK
jgi:hypothetical protein